MSDLATLAESVAIDPLVGHPADFHVFHKFLALQIACAISLAEPPTTAT